MSNVEFYSSNYGIFGLDVRSNLGGTIWPRGSADQYIFAGGFWFAAKKYLPDDSVPHKLVEISYNPNSGSSWFVPGRIDDGDIANQNDSNSYRTYFSSDFNKLSGIPNDLADGPNWPLWIKPADLLETGLYLGCYEYDTLNRNRENYPYGPAIISDEDVFSTYKDTDLEWFDGGIEVRKPLGYPLRLQVEQRIYSWGNDSLKDVVIIYYNIINKSEDTLFDCWFSPIYDFDIGKIPAVNASNDHSKYYNDDRTLNMAICWDDTLNVGEIVNGIMGFSYLMTPAVDSNNYLRKDKNLYLPSEQLGIRTFKNWRIEEDGYEDEDRYNILSKNNIDSAEGKGDMRIIFSTGPFNMLPGDTLRVALSIMFATPDSLIPIIPMNESKPDFTKIVELARYTQNYFYNDLVLKIEDEKKAVNNEYMLYPNPATDMINISSNNSMNIDRIELFNLLGERIIEKHDIYSSQFNLNTRQLQNGTYLVQIKSGNNIESKLLQIAR
ncbi:MAG: T9SS type A sorting domain-containing protein [Ignavibacteriae bacterium]|nr:T9SS type A sorting domain-containing protein [Ignavibacteriota bacterium]